MDYQQLLATMTPEIYQNLKRSVELGKWPNGVALTAQQRENSMQALILWGEANLEPEQRIGFIDKGHKGGEVCDDPQEQAISWKTS